MRGARSAPRMWARATAEGDESTPSAGTRRDARPATGRPGPQPRSMTGPSAGASIGLLPAVAGSCQRPRSSSSVSPVCGPQARRSAPTMAAGDARSTLSLEPGPPCRMADPWTVTAGGRRRVQVDAARQRATTSPSGAGGRAGRRPSRSCSWGRRGTPGDRAGAGRWPTTRRRRPRPAPRRYGPRGPGTRRKRGGDLGGVHADLHRRAPPVVDRPRPGAGRALRHLGDHLEAGRQPGPGAPSRARMRRRAPQAATASGCRPARASASRRRSAGVHGGHSRVFTRPGRRLGHHQQMTPAFTGSSFARDHLLRAASGRSPAPGSCRRPPASSRRPSR